MNWSYEDTVGRPGLKLSCGLHRLHDESKFSPASDRKYLKFITALATKPPNTPS